MLKSGHLSGSAATGMPASTNIVCEIVRSPDRFRELEHQWQRLWISSKESVFQSYYWVEAWWSATAMDTSLHLAVAWREDTIVAILPFVVRRWYGTRILEWAAQAVSDYCCALTEHPLALRQLWDQVKSIGGFDIVRLKNVPPGSPTAQVLGGAIQHKVAADPCLSLTRQWANGDDWFRTLNKKKRNNWSRGSRLLAGSGELTFRRLVNRPEPELLERLVEMKRQSLAVNGLTPSCDTAMLGALVSALERIRALRIFLAISGGNIVAASINAEQGSSLLAYFAVYDAAYARASPGILLMTEYTKWAFDTGLTLVDYLRGEESYKFEFANQMIRLDTYIEAATLIGNVSWALHRLWQTGQRMIRPQAPPQQPEIGSAYATKAGTRRAVPARPEQSAEPVTMN
jgi:CelD/BcsL family acetyltransferase involved in cellulose biosynthesis